MSENHSHILNPKNAMAFILGGKATFTIKNIANQNRFTYKVVNAPNSEKYQYPLKFVKIMNGTDNEGNFGYIGYLKFLDGKYTFIHGGAKAKAGINTPSVKAFNFVYNLLLSEKNHPQLEIWHEGMCCRCGRKLTVPESIESGIGPDCAKMPKR